jgi:YVTN family beta-propeller protein
MWDLAVLRWSQGRVSAMVKRSILVGVLAAAMVAVSGCGESRHRPAPVRRTPIASPTDTRPRALTHAPALGVYYRVPPLLDPRNVYAADTKIAPIARRDRPLVYVPDTGSDDVYEIDPRTYQVVRHFMVGAVPQHIVPSYDLRTLWVNNDIGNSLTAIDPVTGKPGRTVHVDDPYNLYFTPDGRFAMVMAESRRRIDFLDAHTMKLRHVLPVPMCAGVNHGDFTANGRYMLVSCEFTPKMIVIDVPEQRVVRVVALRQGASPQDVKLSPNGRTFYVADLTYGGVWVIGARHFRARRFIHTGAGAHGLYASRNARDLYVSNRGAGTISVIRFATKRIVATWRIPNGSPDMGNVSANGRVLWLSGRYDNSVYAINTRTGKLIRRIPVGFEPHGVCVWPQPGRYSLGHTGVMR